MTPRDRVRLKLYIPPEKYNLWKQYLELNYPNSLFFSNFSSWVRQALLQLPSPGISPLYPQTRNNQHFSEKSLDNKIEKVVWIEKSIKSTLMEKKGHFSLNGYVIFILDVHTFGTSSYQTMLYQILKLQERVNEIENKIQQISEKIILLKD